MKFIKSVVLMLVIAGSVWAGVYAKLTGRVTDTQTGDGLPLAVIKVLGTELIATTDIDGYYVILNVPPGTYDVQASFTGYQSLIVKDVVAETDRTIQVNFPLKPTEVILKPEVIKAKKEILKKSLTEARQVFDLEEVGKIPVMSIQDAINTGSGVIIRGGMHIRGGRPDEVVYVVDGVEIRDPYTNYTTSGVPLLAMQETALDRGGFDVDQGTVSSGVINVVTREGREKYDAEIRFSTTDFSYLGEGVESFFDANTGDPYLDLLRGEEAWSPGQDYNAYNAKAKGRHKAQEYRTELTLSGPLIPVWKEGPKFFTSAQFVSDKGRFPQSQDPNYRDADERYQWKVVFPAKAGRFGAFKLFTSGFYSFSRNRGYSPGWRLALDNLPTFYDRHLQFIAGFDHLISSKTFWEFRFGYYTRHWWENVFEDTDHDGVDDFDDRDYNGLVEVDLDYFKKVYPTDSVWDDTLAKYIYTNYAVNPDYQSTLDSLAQVDPRWEKAVVNEEKGYIEIPFYWWERELQTFYPSFGSGPSWWPSAPEKIAINNGLDTVDVFSPYTRYGWGQRSNIDTFAVLDGDTVDVGNLYLPNDHTFRRVHWRTGKSKLWNFDLRLKSQIGKTHEILAGVEYKKHWILRYATDYASGGNVYYDFVNPDFTHILPDTVWTIVDWFKEHPVNPWQAAVYIRDKIEIEEMVAKVGVRLDYYDPGGWYIPDTSNPFTQDPMWSDLKYLNDAQRAEKKWYISPRLGVSHPITENDVLHLTYGHYFQIPPMYELVRNYVISGAFPVVGNANIEPQKTVSYELGVKHAFTLNWIADVTAFYKDIFKWSRGRMLRYAGGRNYSTYFNEDYGSVRGIEFTLNKRPGGALLSRVSGSITYTFQVAKGSFSNPYQGYYYAWAGYPIPSTESPLNWDQRHKLVTILSYTVPEDQSVLGINDWFISFQYILGSGFPWTPPIRSNREAIENINAERMPSTHRLDMRLQKGFSLGPVKLTAFLDIINLLNNRNLNDIEDTEWYAVNDDPEGEVRNPGVWGGHRTTRIGIFLNLR